MRRSRAYKRKRTAVISGIIFSLLVVIATVILFTKAIPQIKTRQEQSTESTGEGEVSSLSSLTIPVVTEPPIRDITPPVIQGLKDIIVTVGDTVAYKNGITVTDDTDPAPSLAVDASAVDLTKAGNYTVTYTATDSFGNVATEIVNVTVKEKDAGEENYDELMSLARKAVSQCVKDSDDDLKKIHAAYWWVKYNVTYTRDSDKSSWINEAIRGFKDLYGDCFTFFAIMKAMLTVMGYETVDVTRIDGKTRHYWSLVKYNNEWYHIDSCPRSAEKDKNWLCFLRTDDELIEWNKQWTSEDIAYGYYKYDTSLCPESGKYPLNLGEMQLIKE